jgi:Glycosyl transferases group 1
MQILQGFSFNDNISQEAGVKMLHKRILHVANRAERYYGARHYGVPFKINNGMIRSGHQVYWFSDRDMARYMALLPSRKLGVRKCNKVFLEFCRNFRPDIIALCHADILTSETLRLVRKRLREARIFQYNVDTISTPDRIKKVLRLSDVVDATFITTAGGILQELSGQGSFAAFFPNPVDPSIDTCQCHLHDDLPIEVFFAGGLSPWSEMDDLRVQAINKLRGLLPHRKIVFHDNLFGAEYFDTIGRSKIGLCFNNKYPGTKRGDGGSLYLYSSDRISQYMGNGLLTFVGKQYDLATLYGTESLVEVENLDELVTKLETFLTDDNLRRKVAARGHAISHAEFNCERVTQYMLESVTGEPFSYPYRWPTDKFFRRG